MRKLQNWALILVAVITVWAYATPVDTVTMDYTGGGARDTVQIWGGGWSGLNVYAGLYMFDKTAGTGEGEYLENGPIGGFCMDLSEYVADSSKTYEVLEPSEGPMPTTFLGGPMGQEKSDYLSELWGRYYDSSWGSGGSYTSQQKQQAEAFAAAVWEIIYEDLPTSSSGWNVNADGTCGNRGFKATGLDSVLANSWLASLDGSGPMADLRALSYVGVQDFLVEIPEPATVAFFSIGILVLARKRKICTRF